MGLVIFIIGILVGGLLFWLFFDHRKPSGTFIIDFSNIDKDICTLDLDKSLNELYSKKYMLVRIKTIDFNS